MILKKRKRLNPNHSIKEAMSILLHNSMIRLNQTSEELKQSGKPKSKTNKYGEKWYLSPNLWCNERDPKEKQRKTNYDKISHKLKTLRNKLCKGSSDSFELDHDELKSESSLSHISEIEKEFEDVGDPKSF